VRARRTRFGKSNLGWLEQQKIKVDEMTESWGYALGPLQQVAMLLPGLSAGFTGISAALTGMGGISGLAGIAPMLVQAGGVGALGTIAYGYSQNDVGTTFANDLANKIFLIMASLLNATVPGQPFDTQKYIDQQAINSNWDQILGVFGSPEAAGKALGVKGAPIYGDSTYGTGSGTETSGSIGYDMPNGPGMTQGTTITGYAQPTQAEVYAAIVAAAASGNMTVAQYLATPAAQKAGMIATAVPGTGYGGVYTSGYGSLAGSPRGAMPIYNPYQITAKYESPQAQAPFFTNPAHEEYGTGGSGAVANSINAQVATSGQRNVAIAGPYNDVAQQNRLTAALGQLNHAYLGLTDGVMSANDAQATFKATQDGILQSEQVYTGQSGSTTPSSTISTTPTRSSTRRKRTGSSSPNKRRTSSTAMRTLMTAWPAA
jgi:hypothetical protein